MRKDFVMEDCIENPNVGCQQDSKQTSRNKRKALAKNKGKGSARLGIRNSKSPKSSKSHKQLSHSTEGKSDLLLSTEGLGNGNQVEYGEDFDKVNSFAKVRMGHLV